MRCKIWTSLSSVFLFASCGEKIEVSELPTFKYFLEERETGQKENYLLVQGASLADGKYKLSGSGFTSDVPLDTPVAIQPRIKLNYKDIGDYNLKVEFFLADGTPLIQDTLAWTYSLEAPQSAIVAFEEAATADALTVLLVSESRSIDTNEIWIEGDIAPEEMPEGSWRPVPRTSKIPLKLSDGDGLKTIRVKLRNDFENAGEMRTLEIRKKSSLPEACQAVVRSLQTATRDVALQLSGKNDGALYYRVWGDVELQEEFQKFEGKGTFTVRLSPEVGRKKFTVQLRDEAENYCLRKEFVINYKADYQAEGIVVKDQAIWTDQAEVVVQPWIDHFDDDKIEMFILGDIEDDANTFEWLPYKAETTVRLAASNGHRWIRVQYRMNDEVKVPRYTPIYYRPFVVIQGSASPYNVVVSDILGLNTLSIVGCAENYQAQAYRSSFSCTRIGSDVSVSYDLKDGTRVTRSAPFPP